MVKTIKRIWVLILLLAPLMMPYLAFAQGVANYTCKTTSVTSASTPVSILTPGRMTTWTIHPRSGGAVAALAFPYISTTTAAVPTSAPANVMEIPAGSYFTDQVAVISPSGLSGVGQGWAAVLASGVTAITVDACWR